MAVAVPVASVSDITFEGATFNELTDAFGQLVSLEASIRSVLLRVVARLGEFEDEVVSSGYTSVEEWIAVTSGRRTAHSRELLAVSSALGGLPLVSDAFALGELDWDKLVLIAKVADASSDEHFAARHGEYSLAGLRALARHAEPLSVEDVNLAQERRYARWHVRGAEVFLNARLPVDQAAGLLAGIESKLASAGPDPVDGKFPSVGQAKADGLCSMADGVTATVVIEAEARSFSDGVAELDGLASIGSPTLERLCCDSRVQMVAVKDGEALGVGRVSRSIPPWLARRLRHRDKGCRFPGCDRTSWTQGHHIKYWSRSGRTDLDNLITLCSTHHHYVHERGWKIEGDPEHSVTFKSPKGMPVTASPPGLRRDTWLGFARRITDTGTDLFCERGLRPDLALADDVSAVADWRERADAGEPAMQRRDNDPAAVPECADQIDSAEPDEGVF